MALEGKQLGRYWVVRLLGSGGMGEVYLAEDPRIGQQVAIKVIRTELTSYPNAQEAARLFQREARAIGKLDHPHVLPLNDYGEAHIGEMALVYLVMPYRPEGSLVNWIRQHYPNQSVPPAVAAHLVGQAAEALQHAHKHQITHQDVKPSNFLIRTNEKTPALPDVLLADFGIAHIATSTASSSQNLRGTPAYMAPEQALGEAVPASDQYALAVMAYELLTGRLPFQGNAVRLMYQHLQVTPEAPTSYNEHLSKALDDVILRALSKHPEERFASVMAFATAFQNAVQARAMTDASTRISAVSVPKLTSILPDTPLISATLADAPTKFTPPVEDHAEPLAAITFPPAPVAEESSTPVAHPWAETTTESTAPPLPETVDLSEQKGGSPWRAGDEKPGVGGVTPLSAIPPSPPSIQGERTKPDVSRRMVLAGLAGLAVVGLGGSIIWLARSQSSRTSPLSVNSSQTSSTTISHSTPDPTPQSGSVSFPMFGFDLQHTRFNPSENILSPANVSRLVPYWISSAAAYIGSSPAVSNGIVYVGSGDDHLYAFNAKTGAILWTALTGNVIFSSPAVADGIVYVGSDDFNLYAFDMKTGATLWKAPTGNAIGSSPAVADGIVYVGSRDSKLYAFNAATGASIWAASTGDAIFYSSPAVANGVVYVGSFDHNLYAFSMESGKTFWAASTGGRIASSPAVANGIVYIGSDDSKLYAFNAKTGATLWTAQTGGTIFSSPAVANGIVYVSSDDYNLYAFNAMTGTIMWTASLGAGDYYLVSSPTVANGVVYVGSDAHKVYAFNTNSGTLLWSYTAENRLVSSPTVINGVVYIGSDDHHLYAFHIPGTT